MNFSETEDIELMHPGHVGCPGCGAVIAMRLALKAMGEKIVLVIPACCWAVVSGPHPQFALKVPLLHTAFETSGAAASGLRAALDMKGDTETTVVVWAGDGGTFDIGFQSLSGAVERNEDFIYVCYDNEAYMNTGVQRSSSTPYGGQTTTTPELQWKKTRKKNIVESLSGHRISYAATASIAFPEDLIQKFKKAMNLKGCTRFLHVFASCPTGWRIPSELSVKIARLAVQTNIFPLYEVEDGINYTINYTGNKTVKEYLKLQGRFKQLSEKDTYEIQKMVDEDFLFLSQKVKLRR
ncbi:MAG: pyruvate synthase subunit beta [Desulfobacterales bacterium]|nr:pyruvate synthase subunit beta [Desulfobacterales bacterium]MBF0395680.1 pyruvate synthase subunit beta [Desulfobacterales bacterium]